MLLHRSSSFEISPLTPTDDNLDYLNKWNQHAPEERHSFEEQARGILQRKILPIVIPNPKNMSQAICQIFGRFFHTSMICTEIFARNMIHVLHSVISNAICAHFTISIHALVFVHNHRQYIFVILTVYEYNMSIDLIYGREKYCCYTF